MTHEFVLGRNFIIPPIIRVLTALGLMISIKKEEQGKQHRIKLIKKHFINALDDIKKEMECGPIKKTIYINQLCHFDYLRSRNLILTNI